ncbi:MAG: 2-phosphosulfolactate phosphatase [Gemmatimonadetes bacterium]|nr:2-phosphosulfolactate phosphatase [Gemmatimonadota bacterium]
MIVIRTFLTAAEVGPTEIEGSTAVVIDVLRATSTIVEALGAGARAVYPTDSAEEAARLANSLGRDDTLLCGERRGLKIEGFDLGNSPAEFTTERVGGKRLVMSTTNGTRAFLAAEHAVRVVAASLLNLSAVRRAVAGAERLTFICAGRENRFSLDDALCAGMILRDLAGGTSSKKGRGGRSDLDLDDASRAVLALAQVHEPSADILLETAAGAALVEVGLRDDVVYCASRDRHDLVPEMHDRVIRLSEEG